MKKFIAAGTLALGLTVGVAGPSFASGSKPPATPEQTAQRCTKATERIAKAEARLARAPELKAKLQSKLDEANAAGETEKAAKIQAGIDKLTGRVEAASAKLASLKAKVAEKCAAPA